MGQEFHSQRLARIYALLDEVEAQQRAGRDIAVKIEELRNEIARALAPVSTADHRSPRR